MFKFLLYPFYLLAFYIIMLVFMIHYMYFGSLLIMLTLPILYPLKKTWLVIKLFSYSVFTQQILTQNYAKGLVDVIHLLFLPFYSPIWFAYDSIWSSSFGENFLNILHVYKKSDIIFYTCFFLGMIFSMALIYTPWFTI